MKFPVSSIFSAIRFIFTVINVNNLKRDSTVQSSLSILNDPVRQFDSVLVVPEMLASKQFYL